MINRIDERQRAGHPVAITYVLPGLANTPNVGVIEALPLTRHPDQVASSGERR